jgi:disulfide bond formation protein DsbB
MRDDLMTWAGAALAGLAVLGSLLLSWGLGLAACPLCYYQRAFVMGAFGVLLVGGMFGMARTVCLPALALPVALSGLGVALWHVWLEGTGKMQCPAGFLGIGSAPFQAFLIQLLLCAVLLTGTAVSALPGGGWNSVGASVVLAAILALGSIRSVFMPPPPPLEAYKQDPIICRPWPPPKS